MKDRLFPTKEQLGAFEEARQASEAPPKKRRSNELRWSEQPLEKLPPNFQAELTASFPQPED